VSGFFDFAICQLPFSFKKLNPATFRDTGSPKHRLKFCQYRIARYWQGFRGSYR
jgi:hypothetical protein